jgi:(4S)-4-hydroxy-5-phosphonooxypentane-2,3-dione isomerase
MQQGPTTPDAICALTVQFEVVAANFPEFVALVRENAALSVQHEPGCLRFDVLVPQNQTAPKSVLLYEIYRTRADFDLHLATDHYLRFDLAAKHLISTKKVVFHLLSENAKAPSVQ